MSKPFVMPFCSSRIDDNVLLAEYHRVAQMIGYPPETRKFGSLSRFSRDTLKSHFGPRPGILHAYLVWLKDNMPDSIFVEKVAAELDVLEPGLNNAASGNFPIRKNYCPEGLFPFRGFKSPPYNEQGVIYLFSIVARELGYVVETVKQSFPDCIAQKIIRTGAKTKKTKTVRIEFEYRSACFRDHGHNPAGADLIVCWLHDWPKCPIEVLELRDVIAALPRL